MEHRTEEVNPLLKPRSSIITHPKHWYISYNKSNNQVSSIYTTQMAVIKNVEGKGKKGASKSFSYRRLFVYSMMFVDPVRTSVFFYIIYT